MTAPSKGIYPMQSTEVTSLDSQPIRPEFVLVGEGYVNPAHVAYVHISVHSYETAEKGVWNATHTVKIELASGTEIRVASFSSRDHDLPAHEAARVCQDLVARLAGTVR